MAQDCTSNSLKTTAVATGRVPCFRFRVDWDDDGFASTGTWTDESAYVKNIRGEHQATDWQRSIATVGRGVADVVYVTCRNSEESGANSGLRFSPSNTNSSIYYQSGSTTEYGIGEGYGMMKRAVVEMGYENSGTPEYLR